MMRAHDYCCANCWQIHPLRRLVVLGSCSPPAQQLTEWQNVGELPSAAQVEAGTSRALRPTRQEKRHKATIFVPQNCITLRVCARNSNNNKRHSFQSANLEQKAAEQLDHLSLQLTCGTSCEQCRRAPIRRLPLDQTRIWPELPTGPRAARLPQLLWPTNAAKVCALTSLALESTRWNLVGDLSSS